MKKYNNPLNNIRIASPCSANWDEMFGDERKRHCSECKLNVYNLSDMTQTEAENFLLNAEGRVCLQIYRRKDGTILTSDCPVGWQVFKKRVSRFATASFTLIFGFVGGILSFESLKSLRSLTNYDKVPEIFLHTVPTLQFKSDENEPQFGGMVGNLREVKEEILQQRKS